MSTPDPNNLLSSIPSLEEEEIPPPNRVNAIVGYEQFDPEKNIYSLREDLQNSSFPTLAQTPADPAARLLEAAMLYGDTEAIQQLDSYFIKFEMLRTPMDAIAKALDVHVSMARKFYNGYKERQRRAIERLEVNDVLSKSLNALDLVESELLKLGINPQEQTRNRVSALKSAAQVEIMKLDALERNRFYERNGYASNDAGAKDASKKPDFLINIMQNIMSGGQVETTDKFYKDIEAQVITTETPNAEQARPT